MLTLRRSPPDTPRLPALGHSRHVRVSRDAPRRPPRLLRVWVTLRAGDAGPSADAAQGPQGTPPHTPSPRSSCWDWERGSVS